jgi:transglutaminase-like putative cysteine protease
MILMRRKQLFSALVLLIFLVGLWGVSTFPSPTCRRHFELSEDLQFSFTNSDEIIGTIHTGLTNHARAFTINYQVEESDFEEIKPLVDELMTCAMYNTESPVEGDYVRYQYGGYRLNFEKIDSKRGCQYQLIITPTYYSTVEEEQTVTEKTDEILKQLDIEEITSDREKVKAVYDYICGNVKYDYVHANNSHYYKDSTAYAALVQNCASCQGYAVAVFRLLKTVGIECTVVTGIGINQDGEGEYHAWNKVFVDGEYLNIDATWDAGKSDYEYFLIRDEEFVNHFWE